jgi:isopentenyl-diphosphate delta-isomerase
MEDRKKDHIEMALKNQTGKDEKDTRFFYEPIFKGHPDDVLPETHIDKKKMKAPIWISSMTGGTTQARTINHNLAGAAAEFGLGMGLGSCHVLLRNEKHLPDFDLRPILGDDRPFYANMGIAQIEQFVEKDDLQSVKDLLQLLRADGLIVHVNPMQEWLQPEGDRIKYPPLDTIKELLKKIDFNVIVKEVGQGMGKDSLEALLKLPLTALEFGAFGGTNFAKMELMRNKANNPSLLEPLSYIGQTAEEMTLLINESTDKGLNIHTKNLIVSGGIKSFLDGYYLINLSKLPAVYGMASTFLKHAREDYQSLRQFAKGQIEGLKMAYSFLRIV